MFLLQQIDSNAARLEAEANAERAAMKNKMEGQNVSYEATQVDLGQWKAKCVLASYIYLYTYIYIYIYIYTYIYIICMYCVLFPWSKMFNILN